MQPTRKKIMLRKNVNKILLILSCLFAISIFFLLKLFVSAWIALAIALFVLVLIFYSSVFHIGTILGPAGLGLIKANLIAYFMARKKGKSHSEALSWVVLSRYFFSKDSREIIWSKFTDEGEHDTPENEIKSLVYCIFEYEYGGIPNPKLVLKAVRAINKKYSIFSQKYLVL